MDQTSAAAKPPKAETGEKSKRQGGIELSDPSPWPEPVDGAELLNALRDTFQRHLATPEGTPEAMALWVLFAHTHDAHRSSPRLAFVSPVPECGKTTALSILENLVPRALATSNITPAVIFRIIEKRRPTLLIDEADTFLHGSEDMRGILNSGHTRSTATVWRCEGDDRNPQGFSTWAPVAIAKIGKLPPTLESRSIEVQMRRRRPDEQIEPIRPGDGARHGELARKAARWAADNIERLRGSEPAIPEALYNRARDNWKPLIAIADAAGGHWPETARSLAVQLSGSAEDPAQGVQLLADIRSVFDERRVDRLPSDELCEELGRMEDRPWCDFADGYRIKPRQLAKLLKPFGITPKSHRIGERTPKGYLLSDFEDAFARYIQAPPLAPATPQHPRKPEGLAAGPPAT